ncbi:MAG TPA: globin domain-containing protein [Micromonosporaceae bacterium]
MRDADGGHDYHELLDLHHALRLRRTIGRVQAAGKGRSAAELLATWPQRLTDQRHLRESLVLLEPLGDTLAHLYGKLFRDRPHLRALFPDSLDAQRDRLAWSFRQVADGLDQPDRLVALFDEIGQAHRKLGVRTVHYEPFGEAFIEALRIRAGAAWRPEWEHAWSRAYDFVAGVMNCAAEHTSTPPYVKATVVGHERRGPDLAVLQVHPAQPYPYLAGQYATVESPYLPHTWRSYSIANRPSEDGLLEFHVRATGGNRLSDVLVHKVAPGDVLRLAPARGSLTLAPPSGRGQLLIAGGTGLAPIRALLQEIAHRPDPPATWLFVGARTKGQLYDLELLRGYAERYPWLRLVVTVSDEDAYPYEPGTVVDAVSRRGGWAGHDVYVSGPWEMVVAVRQRMMELGVEPDRIRYDRH